MKNNIFCKIIFKKCISLFNCDKTIHRSQTSSFMPRFSTMYLYRGTSKFNKDKDYN